MTHQVTGAAARTHSATMKVALPLVVGFSAVVAAVARCSAMISAGTNRIASKIARGRRIILSRSEDGNKVGNQIDGRERLGSDGEGECLCVPGRARIAGRQPESMHVPFDCPRPLFEPHHRSECAKIVRGSLARATILRNIEAYLLTFLESREPSTLYRGNMHEDIRRAVIGLNEAEAFGAVEPLYRS